MISNYLWAINSRELSVILNAGDGIMKVCWSLFPNNHQVAPLNNLRRKKKWTNQKLDTIYWLQHLRHLRCLSWGKRDFLHWSTSTSTSTSTTHSLSLSHLGCKKQIFSRDQSVGHFGVDGISNLFLILIVVGRVKVAVSQIYGVANCLIHLILLALGYRKMLSK